MKLVLLLSTSRHFCRCSCTTQKLLSYQVKIILCYRQFPVKTKTIWKLPISHKMLISAITTEKVDILQNSYGATGLLQKITVPNTLLSKSDFSRHHLNQAVMQAPMPNPFKLAQHRDNSRSVHILLQHMHFSSNTISTISSIFSIINSTEYIYINSAENVIFDYETNRTNLFKKNLLTTLSAQSASTVAI